MDRRLFLGLSLSAFLAACSQSQTNKPPSAVVLTISVAASLKEAMAEISQEYSKRSPNVTINYNFGASGALQQQIAQGAPVDVFLAAAPKNLNALQEKGLLLTETRQNLLENQLVLIVPQDQVNLKDFDGLTNAAITKIAIGDPDSVPAGQYAQEALTKLKLYDRLKPKLVFAKDVRQVLAYVETGNVDAGLVYITDARISKKVKQVALAPADTYSPIIYPLAVLKNSQQPEAARAFVQFLSSDEAKAVFIKYGFSMAKK
jgi:molybdate transport system substrate-binding protein